MGTRQRLGTQSKDNLLLPGTAEPDEDVFLRDVSDFVLVVVLWVVAEDDALHLVGASTEPAIIVVVEDRLELGLWACDVGHIAHGHAQGAPKDAAKMGSRVLQLICFMIATLHSNEDTQVVLARHHLDRGARKLGRDLVEALGMKALLGAADVESADWRVVGGLFCEVRNTDWLGWVGDGLRDGDGRGGTGVARTQTGRDRKLHRGGAGAAALGLGVACPERSCVDPRGVIFCFPVTLTKVIPSVLRLFRHFVVLVPTYPEELAQARVVRFAWLPLCVLEVLGKPEAQNLQHAVDWVVRGSNRDKGIGRVEVVPVFEVWCRLEELGGKREPDRGEVGDSDESEMCKRSV